MQFTDAAVLSAKVDGTLLVVAAAMTTGKQVTRCLDMLHQVAAPIIGAVLNDAPLEAAYGYAYAYYGDDRRLSRLPDGQQASDGEKATRSEDAAALSRPEG